MLTDDDLSLFLKRFAAARIAAWPVPAAPQDVLELKADGLHSTEVWRLSRSLQVASVLGDVTKEEALAATLIEKAMHGRCSASLTDAAAWEQAIAWALTQPQMAALPKAQIGGWYAL
jgi:hypothetical protein